MSNNQEIIEARLAAYVDSDLDAQERAEIEAHLAQHPQHRRLLEELRKGREFLRGLPRESAPAELAEGFNGQLERSVLLDGAGEFEEPRMRVGRWPQIFAAAAIFFLTVGLAGVVYFALPNHKTYQVATNTPSPKPSVPAPSIVPGKPGEGDTTADADLAKDKDVDRDSAARPKPDTASNIAREGFGKGGLNNNLSKNGSVADGVSGRHDELTALAENVSQVPQVQELLAGNSVSGKPGRAENTPASSDEALVLAVRSNDPGQTEKELAGYLDLNNISWQRTPEQVPASLNTALAMQSANNVGEAVSQEPNSVYGASPDAYKQQSAYARKDEAAAQGRRNELSNAAGTGGGAGQGAVVGDRKFSSEASPPPAPAGVEQRAMAKSAADDKGRTGTTPPAPGQPVAPGSDQVNAPAATDSQAAQVQQPAPVAGQTQQRGQNGQALQLQNGLAAQQAATAEASPIDNLYVARRMSRRQAQELTDRLARNGEVRGANMVRRAGEGNNYALVNNSTLSSNSLAANSASQLDNGAARGVPDPADVTMHAGATTQESADHLRNLAQKPAFGGRGGGADGNTPRENISEIESLKKGAKGQEERPLASAAGGQDNRAVDAVVKKGDSLTLRYRQPAAGAKEAHEESEVVKVKEDGTIAPKGVAVPRSSPVVAAGRTLDDVKKSLQNFEADSATRPAVAAATARRDITVERFSYGPSDAPAPAAPAAMPGARKSAHADNVVANSPATPPAGLAATEPAEAVARRSTPAGFPASQPASDVAAIAPPATQPAADDQVDVVIVVQKDPTPAPDAPPAEVTPAGPAEGNHRQLRATTQPAGQTPAPAR
jgi:hypothetical protein